MFNPTVETVIGVELAKLAGSHVGDGDGTGVGVGIGPVPQLITSENARTTPASGVAASLTFSVQTPAEF